MTTFGGFILFVSMTALTVIIAIGIAVLFAELIAREEIWAKIVCAAIAAIVFIGICALAYFGGTTP